MICIIGDLNKDSEAYDKAEAHLIDTEVKHCIYGTKDIINSYKVVQLLPFLDYKQQIDLLIHLISYCDTVYMLKSWEYNNDARMLHDYAVTRNCKIIYSKKF